jgi:hypothetical protein
VSFRGHGNSEVVQPHLVAVGLWKGLVGQPMTKPNFRNLYIVMRARVQDILQSIHSVTFIRTTNYIHSRCL